MTRQLNAQQQNSMTIEGILRAAEWFRNSDQLIACLGAALRAHGEANASGLLVAARTLPDQGGGDWVQGTWLTRERRFWEFEADEMLDELERPAHSRRRFTVGY